MAYRRRREPAVLTALYLAFILGIFGYVGYLFISQGGMFENMTLRENLTLIGLVLVLWLLLWPLIATRRRRGEP